MQVKVNKKAELKRLEMRGENNDRGAANDADIKLNICLNKFVVISGKNYESGLIKIEAKNNCKQRCETPSGKNLSRIVIEAASAII
jgi:hypothetical protein